MTYEVNAEGLRDDIEYLQNDIEYRRDLVHLALDRSKVGVVSRVHTLEQSPSDGALEIACECEEFELVLEQVKEANPDLDPLRKSIYALVGMMNF